MSDNEDGFELERETLHKNGRWTGTSTVADLSADITNYTDATGQGDFHYRVRSYNSAGTSAWSAWQVVSVTGGSSGVDSNNNHGKGGGKK